MIDQPDADLAAIVRVDDTDPVGQRNALFDPETAARRNDRNDATRFGGNGKSGRDHTPFTGTQDHGLALVERRTQIDSRRSVGCIFGRIHSAAELELYNDLTAFLFLTHWMHTSRFCQNFDAEKYHRPPRGRLWHHI